MEQEVKRFVSENKLIEAGDRIVVGVSGGADSICLLYILNTYCAKQNVQLYVVHINHGLRGQEADEDEAYVKEVCDKLGLHFHAVHVDAHQYAKINHLTEEEAGRTLRYQAFYEECRNQKANKIAIAHNKNDQAETVLFHLFRGSGIKGLTGIPVKRVVEDGIMIIRPLLCMSRDKIEAYLASKSIPYRIDRTNLTDDYSRNKLRNQVIPYVRNEVNQGVVDHIVSTARNLSEIEQYLQKNIKEAYQKYVTIDETGHIIEDKLNTEDVVIQKGVIREIIRTIMKTGLKDVDACHVDMVLNLFDLQVGRRVNLPNGVIARKRYDTIIFERNESNDSVPRKKCEMILDVTKPGEYYLSNLGKTVKIGVKMYQKNMNIPKNAYTKWFDYDKIKNTIFIRTRQTGDYLQVTESGGSKKLKDFFIDRKIPREERDEVLLLADGHHIMWILGDRMSEGYKVSNDTKKILVINLIGGK